MDAGCGGDSLEFGRARWMALGTAGVGALFIMDRGERQSLVYSFVNSTYQPEPGMDSCARACPSFAGEGESSEQAE